LCDFFGNCCHAIKRHRRLGFNFCVQEHLLPHIPEKPLAPGRTRSFVRRLMACFKKPRSRSFGLSCWWKTAGWIASGQDSFTKKRMN
jgi:hypothetical protein